MAQEGLLEELRADFTCPVCLDLLTDPVTLDCGHHCCASCLQQCWQDLLDILPCPVCQHHCAHRELQKNSQLSALADMVKQLPSSGSKRKQQQEQPLCEQHQQVLSLFCEQDLQLVCVQCRVSCEQQGHHVTPTEEAAAQHRKKLRSHVQALKKQLEDAHKGLHMQGKEKREFRKNVIIQKFLILFQCKHYKSFLRHRQYEYNTWLLEEMKTVSQKMTESRDQLSAFGSSVKTLLRDLTDMSEQRDLQLLLRARRLQHLLSSCEELGVPEGFCHTFQDQLPRAPLHYLDFHIASKFKVDLTLDPETAQKDLIISEDRKKVLFEGKLMVSTPAPSPKAFTSHTAVLSSEGFEAGRHFWVVQITGKGVCFLGVCKESFPRQVLMPHSPSNGCWKMQLSIGTHHKSHKRKVTIGVFLDYELGEVWFYNMCKRSPICTLTDTFTEKLFPFFAVLPSSSSVVMTLKYKAL
ncbi:tripartite motif-containing protein 75-like [Erinaceus europaeus]|uniref:Tripartite motif-containing protein 75-like n=1 Tax=Erinaceus europaeus TaxID=9365 RepID=A0ABM3VU02_ERIEU|nr:tripartite motif-containing protein 75-like [Erinaceus europaeus]